MAGKKMKVNDMVYRKPKRTFEKFGSVNPKTSYYVPLENIVNMDGHDLKTMVDRGRYFSIFAPRQSGKTTYLEEIREQLHSDSTYVVVILGFQEYRKLEKARFYSLLEQHLYEQLLERLREANCEKIEIIQQLLNEHHFTDHVSVRLLFEKLNRIIQYKKIVIFIDEFDGIPLSELEGFLTTLRELYLKYKKVKQKALYSVGLVGIRNITKLVVGGVSPFNIADRVTLQSFSLKNVHDLFLQYTQETNQPFTEDAVKRIHGETSGQPWLVNRLGTLLTVNVKPETVEAIDEADVEEAIGLLLIEKNDHFENLYEKALLYKETFVEIVFDHVEYSPSDRDQGWLEQYGLIKNSNDHAVVANEIYKARHIKAFFKEVKANRSIPPQGYLLTGNKLDMEQIIFDFEQYISQIGVGAFYQKWTVPGSGDDSGVRETKPYEKTGQFLLTAWLYQFVRGGAGELRYEVHSGLGRMDVLLTFKGRKYIIETKVNRGTLTRTIKSGIAQISRKYLASESAHEGYLIVFDTKTPVGEEHEPQSDEKNGATITTFIIPIGKTKTTVID